MVLCPEHVPALALLGRIYVEAGQFAVALPHLRLLCRLRPEQPGAWYNCGIAHEQLGRLPEALADFRKFLEVTEDAKPRWKALRQYAELLLQSPKAGA
ncbi:MAG: tetratricopeptide repeat protein, partial [Bryobacteraceae bacterium]